MYDPAKTFLREKAAEKAAKAGAKKLAVEQAKVEEPKEDNGDSVMEEMTPSSSLIEEKPEEEAPLEDDEDLSSHIPFKKAKSAHPALLKLAASPQKGIATEQEKQLVNQTKVYLKRNHLYSELKQIPVTVEQSSCL